MIAFINEVSEFAVRGKAVGTALSQVASWLWVQGLDISAVWSSLVMSSKRHLGTSPPAFAGSCTACSSSESNAVSVPAAVAVYLHFNNPILFAICTSTFSKLCINVYSGM
jgi:hypothetical protein